MFTTQETSYYFLPAQSAPHPHISLSLLHHDHSSNFASSFSSTPTLLTTVAAPPSLATLRLHLDRNNCVTCSCYTWDKQMAQRIDNLEGADEFKRFYLQVVGITLPIMKQALLQAKDGRKHILGKIYQYHNL
ncbi:hypothetical protein ACSBR1_031736 [Camellia fascicularis]